MDRDIVIGLLGQLHAAQNEFYAGGPRAALQQLLAPDITWTVPDDNSIAGTYHGLGWLLPLDQRAFGLIWNGPAGSP